MQVKECIHKWIMTTKQIPGWYECKKCKIYSHFNYFAQTYELISKKKGDSYDL